MRRLGHVVLVILLMGVASPGGAAPGPDSAYADQLGTLVNDYRKRQGLEALDMDESLATLAREHSGEMSKAGSLNHQGMESRVRRSGYAMCVENVGWNYATPQAQLDGWQHSSGHDRNMRDKRVHRMGIGVAAKYVTLIACE